MPAVPGAGTCTIAADKPVMAAVPDPSGPSLPSFAVPNSISWPLDTAPVAPTPLGAAPTISTSSPYATCGKMKLVELAVSTHQSSSTPFTPRSRCARVLLSGRPTVMATYVEPIRVVSSTNAPVTKLPPPAVPPGADAPFPGTLV